MKNKTSNSRIVRVLGRIFNIPYWFDWERVKSFTVLVAAMFKRLFVVEIEKNFNEPQKNVLTESFEAAQKSLQLSDSDLLERQKALHRLSILMALLAFSIFIYSGYQLFWGTFRAVLISLSVMMISLALAFRYHFWYYQIKSRRLGCSFNEWFKKGFLRE